MKIEQGRFFLPSPTTVYAVLRTAVQFNWYYATSADFLLLLSRASRCETCKSLSG
ncbi:MAG: hypothetical protein IKW18_04410 [Clostridia bacterium]|nr:hypothetical protein [Clostridia bacterium]